MKALMISLGLGLILLNQAMAAESVSAAKAAELTCHRIERLVTLKKIPDTFLNRTYSIQLQAIPAAKPTDPAFRTVSSQVPAANGQAQQIEVILSGEGKALEFRVIAGPDSAAAPVWPDKDPVTLTENSLHYVLDNAAKDATLVPFHNAFTSIVLSQVRDSAGAVMSLAQIRSSEVRSVLEVYLKADGTFASARIVNP